MACHIDLAPTLLSLAGVKGVGSGSGGYVGHDLTPILEDVSRTTPRGSLAQPGTGALFTSDTLSTVDWDYVKEVTDEVDLSKRGFVRAVFDGRYKFARYYSPLLPSRGRAETLEDLQKHNDLELYDVEKDPEEMDNLASKANLADPKVGDFHKALILEMNAKLNDLVDAEIGASKDLGATTTLTSFRDTVLN